MSFTSKEKIIDYMYNTLNRFNVPDLKDIAPEYFKLSPTALQKEISSRKLNMNRKNLSEILALQVKKDKWDINDIIVTAFDVELKYLIKYSRRFVWTAYKFVGNSSQEEIEDLSDLIRTTIRNDKKDATILIKKEDDLFWISIIIKNLKKIGIYEKPRYVALSPDGKYFFCKDNRVDTIVKYLTLSLGYEQEKKVKLSGRCIQSLLKLLRRRDEVDMTNRPIYKGGEIVEHDFGLDFTQKKSYFDYFDECVDNTEIDLQEYTVKATNCSWVGDDTPCLQQVELKSAIVFRGNVARIIKQLPVANIVKPPFPEYLRNFSVKGRNNVSLRSARKGDESYLN